jgi:hypothetical protein
MAETARLTAEEDLFVARLLGAEPALGAAIVWANG